MDISQLTRPGGALSAFSKMTSQQLAETERQANNSNIKAGVSSNRADNLNKDSFLKLLVTQLRHQDPTKPMEDKEFISQMAQFSSLEQMTNLNKEVRSLIQSSTSEKAFSLLGKRIEGFNPSTSEIISGTVSSIELSREEPVLKVGDKEISVGNINFVYDRTDEKKAVLNPTAEINQTK